MNFEKSTERVVNVSIRCTACGYDLLGYADAKCPRCGKEDPARFSRATGEGGGARRRIPAGVWVGVVLVLMLLGMLVGAILY